MSILIDFTASTADAAPSSAPYRISRDSAKDDLNYSWLITSSGPIGYWQERFGGTNRVNGTVTDRRGNVCGMGVRCGHPHSRLLGAASGLSRVSIFPDMDSLMGAEGSYRFGVDARIEGEWG